MPSKKQRSIRGRTAKAKGITVKATTVPTTMGGRARTIIYVHGIGNKPPASVLKCQWDQALFGFDLGDKTRMAYWVDRTRYPQPSPGACQNADVTRLPEDSERAFGVRTVRAGTSSTAEALLPAEATGAQRAAMKRLAMETLAAEKDSQSGARAPGIGAKVLPLPGFLRDFFTRRVTQQFLKDVYDFLFVEERREFMRRRVLERLKSGGGPFVVIGHSQGSMVAYDVLRSLPKGAYDIELFITIGSPLGLTEVKDQLKKFPGPAGRLATPEIVRSWLNVADPLDPVAADKRLETDYRENSSGARVRDLLRNNLDSPKDPHSGSGYLRLPDVRDAVRSGVQRDLFQRIGPFAVARDVVSTMENARTEDRHPVLIELQVEPAAGKAPASLPEVRENVVNWIKDNTGKATSERLEIEALTEYVSANLTRFEIEKLASELHLTSIYRVFKNARKRALLTESAAAVHAPTAHLGYGARGRDITWAVLDSGIDADHPHFTQNSNVVKVYDCLTAGDVRERDPKKSPSLGHDVLGHGTHVAGIIAGANSAQKISGIAPETRLISYKVLDDSGSGSDAKIIKAMDHIHETNAKSGDLVVHGVNLSLGGPFNPEVFGCGDSPLCKQLRKLWRQGVVVVLAAGNEGYLEIQQGPDTIPMNVDLSIGDPANLEECLAVGSVHKSRPHLYGVSYFSSRGPTADGRAKPDVVAPGEKILSCRTGGRPGASPLKDCYVAMSGTSMAAPHVSGVAACFLSARREFIGYPDKLKQHLLANCTDLRRERMHQGAGIPNLVKMLLNS